MRGARTTLIALALLGPAATAHAAPDIHAHRGGPLVRGAPTYGENTMDAFRAAAKRRFVLEADVKLTADRVPVVFHDAELDRATDCTGPISARTLAQLREQCRVDILGTDATTRPDASPEQIPTLTELLRLVRKKRNARLNVEIKNQPTDSDFDPGPAFAETVSAAIAASRVPQRRLIVQSFWPVNLQVAQQSLPGAEISLLTLPEMNLGAPAFAEAASYEWVSPAWTDEQEMRVIVLQARALGLRVVPYTIDDAAGIRAAAAAGVDAVISNDPVLAREALGAG